MKKQIEIETDRLILRQWTKDDLTPFILMNQNPEVMKYFPKISTPEETENLYNIIIQEFSQSGYGLYATEEKQSGSFIGFIGFHFTKLDLDFCPSIEIGWRLNNLYWNKGYATEGAKACLEHGFKFLNFDEIYSFTSIENKQSQRVMQKIGLKFNQYFNHPAVTENHPLEKHICYYIHRNSYLLKLYR